MVKFSIDYLKKKYKSIKENEFIIIKKIYIYLKVISYYASNLYHVMSFPLT